MSHGATRPWRMFVCAAASFATPSRRRGAASGRPWTDAEHPKYARVGFGYFWILFGSEKEIQAPKTRHTLHQILI